MIDIIKFEEFKNTFIKDIHKYFNNNENDFRNEDFLFFTEIFRMSYNISEFIENQKSYIHNKLLRSKKLFYMLGFKKYKNNKEVKHEYKKIFNQALKNISQFYFISGVNIQNEIFLYFVLNHNKFYSELKYLMDIYLIELNKIEYTLNVVRHINILPPNYKNIMSFIGGQNILNDFKEFFDEIN